MARDYLQEFEDLRRSWSANENNVGPGSATRSPATIEQAKQYYRLVQNQAALDALSGIEAPKNESYEEFVKRKQLESMPTGISQNVDYGKAADFIKEDDTVNVNNSSLNEETNNKKTPYELAVEKYNKELSDYDNERNIYNQKLDAMYKNENDKRSLWLDSEAKGLSPEERMVLYKDLQATVKADKEYLKNYENFYNKPKPTAPNQKDFEELINKSINKNNNSDQNNFEDFLNNNNQKTDASNPSTLKSIQNNISETPESRYEDFIAQSTFPPGPSGYKDPSMFDPKGKGFIPIITPGSKFRPGEGWNIIDPFKNSPNTGPGLSETPEKTYENFIAQSTFPSGPSGYNDPKTFNPNNIIPIITPGSKFRPGEGWKIIDPFKNSPQTGPGLSETPEKTYENFIANVKPQTSSVSKDETLTKYNDLLTQLQKSKREQTEQRTSPTTEFSNTVGLLNELNAFDNTPEENTPVLIADNQTGNLSDGLPSNVKDARNWAKENPGKYNPFLPDAVNRYFMGLPKRV